MMNKRNIKKAIAVMERAALTDSVKMHYLWQWNMGDDLSNTEEELVQDNSFACFGGYIAISKEWNASPFRSFDRIGRPFTRTIFGVTEGVYALLSWLGISAKLMDALMSHPSEFYGKPHPLFGVLKDEIRAKHYVQELKLLVELGESKYMQLRGI